MLSEVTDEVVEAFGRLLPQLSRSAPPLDRAALAAIVASPAVTVLLARSDGSITGTLTLVMFRAPGPGGRWPAVRADGVRAARLAGLPLLGRRAVAGLASPGRPRALAGA